MKVAVVGIRTRKRRRVLVREGTKLSASGVAHLHGPGFGCVGATRLERIPFIDVGTRGTRKRKGLRRQKVKERAAGRLERACGGERKRVGGEKRRQRHLD